MRDVCIDAMNNPRHCYGCSEKYHCHFWVRYHREGRSRPDSYTAELYIGNDHYKTMAVKDRRERIYTAFLGPMPELFCGQEIDAHTTVKVKTWTFELVEQTSWNRLKYRLVDC